MPSPLETVRTDVDLLIELVKKKKEISFDEAAKELKLPSSTIESWASFLEEDGIVAIKYKFTTPYLYYSTAAGKASEELELRATSTFEDKIKEIENLLESAFSHIKNGNYEMAESIYPALNQEIRTVHALMKEKDTLNNLPLGEGVMDKLKEVDQTLEHAKQLTESGDYEKAREIYISIHNEVREVILLVREMNMELIKMYGEKKVLDGQIKKEEDDLDLKKISDVDELLKKAYEYLKSGEMDKAKKIYDKIQDNYDELAEEYRGKKEELNKNLIKLNKDLSLHIGKVSMKEIEEKEREINRLAKEVKANLEKNNIPDADKFYAKIEEVFKDFPTSFLEKRLEAEKKILDLREELIQKRRTFLYSELKAKGDEIRKLVAKITQDIMAKDVKNAMEDYGKIKNVYSNLPAGFLNEKIELQETIFEVYKKLIEINKEVSQEDFMQKSEKIGSYVSKAEQLLNSNELAHVEDFLNKGYEVFNQLPMGFLSEKTNIQDRLLKLSRRFADAKEKSTMSQYNDGNERIKKLFKTIEHYLANKEFDLAKEVYSEITNVYNQLPPGFMGEKTELKTKILSSYKKLMLGADETFLKDVNQATKDKYENLLRLIIQIHSHIESAEFDSIEPNYQHVINLYNELPLGFLTKKINIRDEISKVYDELRMYKQTKQIDTIINSRDYSKVIPMLNSLHELYQNLIVKSAQDVEIFKFVNQRYESYLNVLKMYSEEETLVKQGLKIELAPPVAIPAPPKPEELPTAETIADKLRRVVKKAAPPEMHVEVKIERPAVSPTVSLTVSFDVHHFRQIYNDSLLKLSKKDFAAAKERISEIEKNRVFAQSGLPMSELLSHLMAAKDNFPDYVASLVALGIKKAEHSYEGKLMLTKMIRGLNTYFNGDTSSALKDMDRIKRSFRNAFEVREVIDYMHANPLASAIMPIEPKKPDYHKEKSEKMSNFAPEPPLVRPSVEKLLILKKMRRANEAFIQGDYESSRSDFERVLEIDPDNKKAIDMIGKIEQLSKKA